MGSPGSCARPPWRLAWPPAPTESHGAERLPALCVSGPAPAHGRMPGSVMHSDAKILYQILNDQRMQRSLWSHSVHSKATETKSPLVSVDHTLIDPTHCSFKCRLGFLKEKGCGLKYLSFVLSAMGSDITVVKFIRT